MTKELKDQIEVKDEQIKLANDTENNLRTHVKNLANVKDDLEKKLENLKEDMKERVASLSKKIKE